MNRLETLMYRWEDGSIDEAEFAELKGLLRDRENRGTLVRHLLVSHTIQGVLQEQKFDSEWTRAIEAQEGEFPSAPTSFPRKVVTGPPRRRREISRRKAAGGTPLFWIVAASAAALLAIVVGARQFAGPEVEKPLEQTAAQVDLVEGDAFKVAAGVQTPLQKGMWVQPGEVVGTGPSSHVLLAYTDRTQITLEANSRCAILPDPAKHLRLEQGTLEASVTAQSTPMKVFAGLTETTVLGTRFKVLMGPRTRIELYRGSIQVAVPSSGQSFVLTQDHYAYEEKGRLVGPLALKEEKDPRPIPEKPFVQSITLIDPVTGKPVAGYDPIDMGKPISLSQTGLAVFNLRVNARPEVGMLNITVYMQRDGKSREACIHTTQEKVLPFAVFNDYDKPGDYKSREAQPGSYRIVIQSFRDEDAKDPYGPPETFIIRITE